MNAPPCPADPTPVCKTRYNRTATGEAMTCTFRNGHDSVCSWTWAQREDDARAEAAAAAAAAVEPPRDDVDVLIENIAAGRCDPYLEAILAAAHGRKRARRDAPRPYGRTGVQ